MEARELRIGNTIYYKKVVVNLEIDDFREMDIGNALLRMERIPLTEEWLLKLGFEKCDVRFTSLFKIDCDKFNNGILEIYRHEGEGLEFSVRTNNKIKIELYFVHQLQNLYFALTGTELEIK